MQCDQTGKYRNSFDCFRQTVASDGVSRLFNGWQVAFSRGVPGAAITFTVHNYMMEKLSD
jgi:hypothetical protein